MQTKANNLQNQSVNSHRSILLKIHLCISFIQFQYSAHIPAFISLAHIFPHSCCVSHNLELMLYCSFNIYMQLMQLLWSCIVRNISRQPFAKKIMPEARPNSSNLCTKKLKAQKTSSNTLKQDCLNLSLASSSTLSRDWPNINGYYIFKVLYCGYITTVWMSAS